MSTADQARRSYARISIAGEDVSSDLQPYFISATYTDNEEDEADDLQIVLQDRESIWVTKWFASMLEAASSSSSGALKIEASFFRENWNGDGKTDNISTGEMELDSVTAGGPPSSVTIKATSLPFSSQIRQTEQSKAWESYFLSKIASEIAEEQGMTCMFLADKDPFYRRVEQFRTSDMVFLSKLCHEAGFSLKATGNQIVIFGQPSFEAKDAILTIKRGSGTYTKYNLSTGRAGTDYSSCRVSYVDPKTGSCIEATVTVEDYDQESQTNQQLEITAAVSSIAEAQNLAEKYLRLYNKYAKTVSFTIPGNPSVAAGLNVTLEGWGAFDGKWVIKQAKHTISKKSGYTTQINCRPVIPYFEYPTSKIVQEETASATGSSSSGSGSVNVQKKSSLVKAIQTGVSSLAAGIAEGITKGARAALNNSFVFGRLAAAARSGGNIRVNMRQ